jgi:hypothetical protein
VHVTGNRCRWSVYIGMSIHLAKLKQNDRKHWHNIRLIYLPKWCPNFLETFLWQILSQSIYNDHHQVWEESSHPSIPAVPLIWLSCLLSLLRSNFLLWYWIPRELVCTYQHLKALVASRASQYHRVSEANHLKLLLCFIVKCINGRQWRKWNILTMVRDQAQDSAVQGSLE